MNINYPQVYNAFQRKNKLKWIINICLTHVTLKQVL